MSLDKNLFTLYLTQNAEDPQVVDLVDPSGMVHYRKQRISGIEYKVEVYGNTLTFLSVVSFQLIYFSKDPISESLLITATSPSPTNKFKTLELCNPTMVVELKYTGTLSFRWSFKWEE